MSDTKSQSRNLFYFLLLLASLLFVLTALAYAVVPILEEKATQAGNPPPQSAWRDDLRENGWRWLLYEVAAMILFAFLSMGLDRHRRLQNERAAAKIAVEKAKLDDGGEAKPDDGGRRDTG